MTAIKDVLGKIFVFDPAILRNAGFNILIGLIVVFTVLIFMIFIISMFKYINLFEKKIAQKKLDKQNKPVEPKKEVVEVVQTPVVGEVKQEDDLALVAVITAAVAMMLDTTPENFIVRSINRVHTKKRS